MFKNTAGQKVRVFAFDKTTGTPKTGDAANITAYVNKDWAGVNVLGDTSATELDATNASGYYLFDLTQAETNADALDFSAKSSTANIVFSSYPTVYTDPPSYTSFVTPTGATVGSVTGAVGSVTGNVGGNVTGTVGSVVGAVGSVTGNVGGNVTGSVGSVTGLTTTTIADGILDRDMSVGTDSGSPTVRTVRQALRFLRNKWAISAGTLTVRKEDDTTASWTAVVTTDAAAVPIIGNDPA